MDNEDNIISKKTRGLSALSLTEMLERFSYYGMQAILLYYMYYSAKMGGLGLNPTMAASIFAIYGSISYLSAACGGYVSDRILGSQKTVIFGSILIIIGQLILSMPLKMLWTLFISLMFLTIGTGLLKPTISTMVGNLYDDNSNSKAYRFTVFLFGINFGALLAPIIIGFLGLHFSFHLGFFAGAIAMIIGLIIFKYKSNEYNRNNSMYTLNPIEPYEVRKIIVFLALFAISLALTFLLMWVMDGFNLNNIITLLSIITVIIPFFYFFVITTSTNTTDKERKNMRTYILLFICAAFFWGIEEQSPIVIAMLVNSSTDNSFMVNKWLGIVIYLVIAGIIGYLVNKKIFNEIIRVVVYLLLIVGFLYTLLHHGAFELSINKSWYQSINPLFILLFTPLFAKIWRNKEMSATSSFPLGMLFASLSCLVILLPIVFFSAGQFSPLWIVLTIGIVCIGEMFISPIGLSVTYRFAPRKFVSQMMGVWYLSDSIGQAINSQIVKYFSVNNVNYFLTIGLIGVVLSVIMFVILKTVEIEK